MIMKYIITLMCISSLFLISCTSSESKPDTMEGNMETDVSTTVESPDAPVASNNTEVASEELNEEEGVMVGGAMMVESKDIVDNAINSSDHTTLVAAVQAAELVEALKGEGPFTVFAPVNDAFAALPEGTVETLLEPTNKDQLTAILTYHVVSGLYAAADLEDGMTLTTLQWDDLTITYEDSVWKVNGAMISVADARSSNGVTHVIDTVLIPAE